MTVLEMAKHFEQQQLAQAAKAHSEFDNRLGANPYRRPLLSTSIGVHPSQIGEAEKFNATMGLNTKYDSKGRAIFTSHRQRNRHLKVWQAHDKQSYY